MMKKIENIDQLKSELSRLRSVSKLQENQIKNDVVEIAEGLKPENILWNTFSAFTGINLNKENLFKDGIAFGLSTILQQLIFKTEKNIEDKAKDFLSAVFERIKKFIKNRSDE